MKKILSIFTLAFLLSISASAQHQVKRSFLVPDTPQQLELTYTNHVPLNGKNGSLYIKNQSDKDLKNVHIIVSVKISWTDTVGSYPQKRTKKLILCDDQFDIAAYETNTLKESNRGIIKGGPEKKGKTYSYDIEVTF